MTSQDAQRQAVSPFHTGEQSIQEKLGVREQMERFGSRVIRDHMPDQHREFYQQLPFIFAGFVDNEGWPWASILCGQPGFVHSDSPYTLSIDTTPLCGDPLLEALQSDLHIGLLGIELPTRRRNRLTTHVESYHSNNIRLRVDQSFGNCPQYIQTRSIRWRSPHARSENLAHVKTAFGNTLDDKAIKLISESDTFFVASSSGHQSKDPQASASFGADVSHRGGQPGFIKVAADGTLTIPDFPGNNHFNTFGNFECFPKAGLLFLDFETGDVLSLTGRVSLHWDKDEIAYFDNATRYWRFHLEKGCWLHHALPFKLSLEQYSSNTLLSGTWSKAESQRKAAQEKDLWLPYSITRIETESERIKSFYLEARGHTPARFQAGQFLTIKVPIDDTNQVRTYTVSSSPAEAHYRISVKRENRSSRDPNSLGIVSHYLHTAVEPGDIIFAKAPQGTFKLQEHTDQPLLLIAGGVGITPMIAMIRHTLNETFRTRMPRQIILIAAARNAKQRAFYQELKSLSSAASGMLRVYWVLSEPEPHLKPGLDFQHKGRISKELLQAILPLDNYASYLCGPSGFMQTSYDLLLDLGVSDQQIHTEAFGPSSLKRQIPQPEEQQSQSNPAEEALVHFIDSQVEQLWTPQQGTLLEFAESHGLNPDFSCRSGQCGACKVILESGTVSYATPPSIELAANEVLLCCAQPAKSEEQENMIGLRA